MQEVKSTSRYRPEADRSAKTKDDDPDFEDRPLEWALRKADESLDAAGEKVPDAARGAITYVTSTFGTNASKYAFDAVKIAAKGSSQLIKAALPAGRWMMVKGAKIVAETVKEKNGRKKNKGSTFGSKEEED